MFMIEKQYSNVTPRQAQSYIEASIKKINPTRLAGASVEDVAMAEQRGLSYRIETVNGISTTTDYTVDNYDRINYCDGNCGAEYCYYTGCGKKVDYESRNFEYVKRGYRTTAEETGREDSTEIYREKTGDYQFYLKNADGCYNIICEFTFHSDTKGSCYYYECDSMKSS